MNLPEKTNLYLDCSLFNKFKILYNIYINLKTQKDHTLSP